MKDIFLKWWNRKWSCWEHIDYEYKMIDTPDGYKDKLKYVIFCRSSNDGLIEFKKVKYGS